MYSLPKQRCGVQTFYVTHDNFPVDSNLRLIFSEHTARNNQVKGFPMQHQRTQKPADLQGELFAKAVLPRQLPIFKATPEDEQLPRWTQALREKQVTH
jgi:hypothetical protein